MEQKMALLAKNPAEVFVVTHRKDDGTIEYSSPMTGPGGECLCAVMDDSWFDAVWYESQDEAESTIADSVRNIYSVERIRISRENLGSGRNSRENLERDVVVTRKPERISFKCSKLYKLPENTGRTPWTSSRRSTTNSSSPNAPGSAAGT